MKLTFFLTVYDWILGTESWLLFLWTGNDKPSDVSEWKSLQIQIMKLTFISGKHFWRKFYLIFYALNHLSDYKIRAHAFNWVVKQKSLFCSIRAKNLRKDHCCIYISTAKNGYLPIALKAEVILGMEQFIDWKHFSVIFLDKLSECSYEI